MKYLLTLILIFAFASPLPAQRAWGLMSGRITTESGMPVVNARVRVMFEWWYSVSYTAKTNTSGYYVMQIPYDKEFIVRAEFRGRVFGAKYLAPSNLVPRQDFLYYAAFKLTD